MPNHFFKNLGLLAGTMLFLFLCLELTLSFFPVCKGFWFQTVNKESDVFRASPDRVVQRSVHWDMKLNFKKKVNNAGFVNLNDYLKPSYFASQNVPPSPLVAVVGDSYVEATQVNDTETFFHLLDVAHKDLRVYSFGFSGAGLSQYLIWARHAQQIYKNDYLIINIVGNDFDESLKKYKFSSGFYHYDRNQNGDLELTLREWGPKWHLQIVKSSNFMSYLFNNLLILNALENIKSFFSSFGQEKKPKYAGNVEAFASQNKVKDSYEAIEAFFRDLPKYSGLEPGKILFVMDGMRGNIYDKSLKKQDSTSYFNKMRVYFFKRAKELGYNNLDLQIDFEKHYDQNGIKFEFPYDGHWNKLGHEVVSKAIMETTFWQSLLDSRKETHEK